MRSIELLGTKVAPEVRKYTKGALANTAVMDGDNEEDAQA